LIWGFRAGVYFNAVYRIVQKSKPLLNNYINKPFFGFSVKYQAMETDHPLPPDDDQQRLEDAELSRPPWND